MTRPLFQQAVESSIRIRDQREQPTSTERQLVLVDGPAALCFICGLKKTIVWQLFKARSGGL
jgi:hypothetical protein